MNCCEKLIFKFKNDGKPLVFQRQCKYCGAASRVHFNGKTLKGSNALKKLDGLISQDLLEIDNSYNKYIQFVSGGLCSGVGKESN